MPTKRYKPEQIVTLLRQIEVEIANGKTTPQACKEAQITVQTCYRWRKEFDQRDEVRLLENANESRRLYPIRTAGRCPNHGRGEARSEGQRSFD
jgi:hypothetical protein